MKKINENMHSILKRDYWKNVNKIIKTKRKIKFFNKERKFFLHNKNDEDYDNDNDKIIFKKKKINEFFKKNRKLKFINEC